MLLMVLVLVNGDGEYAELMRVQEKRLNRWACEMGYDLMRVYGRQRPAEGSARPPSRPRDARTLCFRRTSHAR